MNIFLSANFSLDKDPQKTARQDSGLPFRPYRAAKQAISHRNMACFGGQNDLFCNILAVKQLWS